MVDTVGAAFALTSLLGLLLFIAIALLGLYVTYRATQAGWRWAEQSGGTGVAIVAAAAIFLISFLGGWILITLYWLGSAGYRRLRPFLAGS